MFPSPIPAGTTSSLESASFICIYAIYGLSISYASFVSCPDWVSARGMRMLGAPVLGDARVISGESGAGGMGLLSALMEDDGLKDLREYLRLGADSHVLLFSTEGDTDPDKYNKIVGRGEYPAE